MTDRFSKKDVRRTAERLCSDFNIKIELDIHSPGDGATRYQIKTGGATVHTLGARAAMDVLYGIRAGVLAGRGLK